jgi:hypothetical protein
MNDIAIDLKGFLDDMFPPNPAKETAPIFDKPEPVSLTKDGDGVWTLTFHGTVLGWINRVTYTGDYRAMSKISYEIKHFPSMTGARSFLFEQSH